LIIFTRMLWLMIFFAALAVLAVGFALYVNRTDRETTPQDKAQQ